MWTARSPLSKRSMLAFASSTKVKVSRTKRRCAKCMLTSPRESAKSVRPPESIMLVIWAPQSIADLQDIWDYIAEDNPRAATELVGAVRAKAEYLSRNPRLGRPGRGKKLRYLPVVGTPY